IAPDSISQAKNPERMVMGLVQPVIKVPSPSYLFHGSSSCRVIFYEREMRRSTLRRPWRSATSVSRTRRPGLNETWYSVKGSNGEPENGIDPTTIEHGTPDKSPKYRVRLPGNGDNLA